MSVQLPPNSKNAQDQPRKIGVEIEFSGLPVKTTLKVIQTLFGGSVSSSQAFVHYVENTELGDFKVELDAGYAIRIGDYFDNGEPNLPIELAKKAAEQVIPWEIVTAPIEIQRLCALETLVEALRKAGALGTRHAWYYAFGLHLNPELTSLEPDAILSHIRAYTVLYDWIKRQEQVDVARQLTTYINHYRPEYIALILNPEYQPDLPGLIDDYLEHNCTRNRGLDLLPLFSWLDAERVASKIEDERINARPTFHYRLPNCDIDNPDWNIDQTWNRWLRVETLANDSPLLIELCQAYTENQQRLMSKVDGSWADYIDKLIVDNKIKTG